MLKKLLISKIQHGKTVRAEGKDLIGRSHVVRLKIGDETVAKVIWNNGIAKVTIPELDFNEVNEVEHLSKKAKRVIREVRSYLN